MYDLPVLSDVIQDECANEREPDSGTSASDQSLPSSSRVVVSPQI